MVITRPVRQAVTKIFRYEGKLTSNAVRVPVPNVSLAILKSYGYKKTTVEEVNGLPAQRLTYGKLVEQIDFLSPTR